MKQISKTPRTGIKPSQAGTAHRSPRSALFSGCLAFGASFVVFVILTMGFSLLTPGGRKSMSDFLAALFNGANAPQLFAHLAGLLATVALIVALAVFATLLNFLMKGTPHRDKVLAALRFTLKNDPDDQVRAEAAKGLAKVDVEESTFHQGHEELDDTLISALQKDASPRVRAEAAEGLSESEEQSLEQEHNRLDDMIFRR